LSRVLAGYDCPPAPTRRPARSGSASTSRRGRGCMITRSPDGQRTSSRFAGSECGGLSHDRFSRHGRESWSSFGFRLPRQLGPSPAGLPPESQRTRTAPLQWPLARRSTTTVADAGRKPRGYPTCGRMATSRSRPSASDAVPAVLRGEPCSSADRDRWRHRRPGASRAQRQAQLAYGRAERLDPEVRPLSSARLAAHSEWTRHDLKLPRNATQVHRGRRRLN
jgi:hypothetical protein